MKYEANCRRGGGGASAARAGETRRRLLLSGTIFVSTMLMPALDHALQATQETQGPAAALAERIREVSNLAVTLPDGGWTWLDEEIAGTPESGFATFSRAKWLMYLLHWGPIQTREVTPEYVRQRMLGMWNVPFEFSGKTGATRIAGHDAVWVEAFGTDNAFYTRFTIWNCPETGREFVTDSNYNLRTRTPAAEFEAQQRSAATIRCHRGAVAEEAHEDFAEELPFERYGFSFRYPSRWFFFDSPFRVPFPEYDGVRDRAAGSILALASDENLRVVLEWSVIGQQDEARPSMGADRSALERLHGKLRNQPGFEAVKNHGSEEFRLAGTRVNRIWGVCRIAGAAEEPRPRDYTGEAVYQAAEWNLPSGRRITVVLLTRQYRFGTAVSNPAREAHDLLLREMVRGLR
jgi:hypothetical protein